MLSDIWFLLVLLWVAVWTVVFHGLFRRAFQVFPNITDARGRPVGSATAWVQAGVTAAVPPIALLGALFPRGVISSKAVVQTQEQRDFIGKFRIYLLAYVVVVAIVFAIERVI